MSDSDPGTFSQGERESMFPAGLFALSAEKTGWGCLSRGAWESSREGRPREELPGGMSED